MANVPTASGVDAELENVKMLVSPREAEGDGSAAREQGVEDCAPGCSRQDKWKHGAVRILARRLSREVEELLRKCFRCDCTESETAYEMR